MPSCLLYSLSHLILIQHFFLSNHLPLSLCRSISCIISPTSVTFLLFPSVFQFIPPRTHPPSHYLLPAGINLKYTYTDRSQIQSPKCILTWPRACVWWSQVELMQWPFPYCNLCMWLFHKIANTHMCRHVLTNEITSVIFAMLSNAGRQNPVTVGGSSRRQVKEVAYDDNNTKALVFSKGGCIMH